MQTNRKEYLMNKNTQIKDLYEHIKQLLPSEKLTGLDTSSKINKSLLVQRHFPPSIHLAIGLPLVNIETSKPQLAYIQTPILLGTFQKIPYQSYLPFVYNF